MGKVLFDILVIVMTFMLNCSESTDEFGNLIENGTTWKNAMKYCLDRNSRLLDENEIKNYKHSSKAKVWTREYKTFLSTNWNVNSVPLPNITLKICKVGFYAKTSWTFRENNCTKEHWFLCKLDKESLTSAGKKHTTETPSTKDPKDISKDNIDFITTNRDDNTTTDVISSTVGQKHTTETPSSKEPQNISKDNVEFMATNRDNDTTDVISSTIGSRQHFPSTSERLVTTTDTSNKNTLKPHGIEEESTTITLILSGSVGGGFVVYVVIIICIVRKRTFHDSTTANGEPPHIHKHSEPYSVVTRSIDEMKKEQLDHVEMNGNMNTDVKVGRNNQILDEDIGVGDNDQLNNIQAIKNTSMVKSEIYQGQDDIYNHLDNATTNQVVIANHSNYDHVVINHNNENSIYSTTNEKICTSNDDNYDHFVPYGNKGNEDDN